MENSSTDNKRNKHGKLNARKFKKALIILSIIFSIVALIFCGRSLKKFIIILLIEEIACITLILFILKIKMRKSRKTYSYKRVDKHKSSQKQNSKLLNKSAKRNFNINIDDFDEINKSSEKNENEISFNDSSNKGKLIRYDFSRIKTGLDNIDNVDIKEIASIDIDDNKSNNTDKGIIESRNVSIVKKGAKSSLDYFEGPRISAPGWGLDFKSEKSENNEKLKNTDEFKNELTRYNENNIENDEYKENDEPAPQAIENEDNEYKEAEIERSYTYIDEQINEKIAQPENEFINEIQTDYEYIHEFDEKSNDNTEKEEMPQISNELINQIIDEIVEQNDNGEDVKETQEKYQNDRFPKILTDNYKKTEQQNSIQSKYIVNSNLYNIGENKSENNLSAENNYNFPPIELLDLPPNREQENEIDTLTEQNAVKLMETLASFGVGASMVNISIGPTVTRFELQPNTGVKVSKIVSLADDIALNLAATGVRIEAPIPGKAAVGIEIPNKEVRTVYLREVIETKSFYINSSKLSFAVGKSITGRPVVADIARMPHLLIAGATGSGKSVCINTLITSILYKASPEEVKLLMIDPKVVELNIYNGIPHLLIPVVTDPKKAAAALGWAVHEMTTRYGLFAECNVRDLKGYNEYLKLNKQPPLPQIVIIIDELADLMMVSPAEVEDSVCRLAQMARAAGIHLVIATQRPSVDVITGLIKANIPSRIAFAVSSHIDSRTILDMAGAEKLLGKGDMLFYPAGESKPMRVQGAYISDKEVERIVSFIKSGSKCEYDESILDHINNTSEYKQTETEEDDELLPRAVEIVLDAGQASTSLLQRKLRIGYARAARIIDQLESMNIVSGYENGKPRQVLITKSEWMQMMQG